MLNRSHACAALIICSSVALAQDASTPPADAGASQTGPSAATGNLITPPSILQTPPAPSVAPGAPTLESASEVAPATTEKKPAADEQEKGFSLPGGFGYAPLNFTPGQGRFDRAPLTLSTTLQQGYDDNIYSSSGQPGAVLPVKGSLVTNLSEGVDLLLSQSRLALSLQAAAGGEYYPNRTGDELAPNGNLNLLFAYKLTPRAQFSAVINGAYTTQSGLSVVNGLTQSNGKGYLIVNSKFDLLYQWMARVSTDTTYTAVGTYYSGAAASTSNYLEQTVGQSVRYQFSSRVTGVVEARASDTGYNTQSALDSDTYYLLTGLDVTLSRRLAGSFRVGGTEQEYKTADLPSSASPYFEGSLDYTLTQTTTASLSGRYGFDSGNAVSQSAKNTRVGLNLSHVFSSKLRGTISGDWNHTGDSSTSTSQDAMSASVGLQYALSQKLTLFTNITRFQVFASDAFLEDSRDTYYLGATYQY